ncbi:MAG: hypothetical protein WKG01_24195 [Kofleriaceae bacterium]
MPDDHDPDLVTEAWPSFENEADTQIVDPPECVPVGTADLPALERPASDLHDTVDSRLATDQVDALAATYELVPEIDRGEIPAAADRHHEPAAADDELDSAADDLVTALERGLGLHPAAVEASGRPNGAIEPDDDVDLLLGVLEHELRTSGSLSFATCEALRADHRLRGYETCLMFLRCTVFAGDGHVIPIVRRRRVQTCRLLLLSIAAHTGSPRWSSFQVEQMLEAALAIPGAELSDLVQALFALLVEPRGPVSFAQARFIRELGVQVAGKRRRGHSADDFVWIAVRLADPSFPPTEAQAFFAAHALPRKLRVATRETIMRAVQSIDLADEVLELLG